MEDNSTQSENDHSKLTEQNVLRVTSTVATQTPELHRHAILTNGSDTKSIPKTSFVVLRVDKQKDLTDFEKEAKALDIPDVVVEYIKDSCALTGNTHEPSQDFGKSNPAFDAKEELTRVPSSSSLGYNPSAGSNDSSQNSLQADEHIECNGFGTQVPHSRRMYHSMPRNLAKKRLQQEFQLHSQPSSPKLLRHNAAGQANGIGPSNLLYEPEIPPFLRPPSPGFGYREAESETSAVYTIIKTCINANDVKEIHFLPSLLSDEKSTPIIKRKFEFTAAPPAVEKKRMRLQCLTDACSVLFLLPGLLLCIFTPILIVPMFLYPITYFIELMLLFLASGTLGVITLTFSGLLGNMVWHYDEKSKKLRLKLHCGTGPLRHFWGNGFRILWSDKEKHKSEQAAII